MRGVHAKVSKAKQAGPGLLSTQQCSRKCVPSLHALCCNSHLPEVQGTKVLSWSFNMVKHDSSSGTAVAICFGSCPRSVLSFCCHSSCSVPPSFTTVEICPKRLSPSQARQSVKGVAGQPRGKAKFPLSPSPCGHADLLPHRSMPPVVVAQPANNEE